MTNPAQVLCTPAAAELIAKLRRRHGALMFHQSGGCCDGSSPMCFPLGEFPVGEEDVLLGTIEDVPFYMSRSQFAYWKHTELTVDVVPGRGGMFSLEGSEGVRFLVRSRVFTGEELEILESSGRLRRIGRSRRVGGRARYDSPVLEGSARARACLGSCFPLWKEASGSGSTTAYTTLFRPSLFAW